MNQTCDLLSIWQTDHHSDENKDDYYYYYDYDDYDDDDDLTAIRVSCCDCRANSSRPI